MKLGGEKSIFPVNTCWTGWKSTADTHHDQWEEWGEQRQEVDLAELENKWQSPSSSRREWEKTGESHHCFAAVEDYD